MNRKIEVNFLDDESNDVLLDIPEAYEARCLFESMLNEDIRPMKDDHIELSNGAGWWVEAISFNRLQMVVYLRGFPIRSNNFEKIMI